ncbi:MAG: alpha/beta hydrolase family protein [Solirubrobacteraceae bacterium]
MGPKRSVRAGVLSGGRRERRMAVRLAVGVVIALAAILIVINLESGSERRVPHESTTSAARLTALASAAKPPGRASAAPLPTPTQIVRRVHPRAGILVVRLVDPKRTMSLSGRVVQRSFETIVRYPVGLRGPFPLVVFGHGFAVSPAPYARLLDAWTKAGYIVASPVFPLENAGAPGGPNENDLPNQPGDMSLVISRLSNPTTPGTGRIAKLMDPRRIAVTGQSDGGDTALAVAYDPSTRDRRVTAAMILSGAEDPFARQFTMPADGPPLLAIQGTSDTINPPDMTYAFFDRASAPKFLLKLFGAGHLPPYTQPGTELTIVEHMTLAFLNHFLKGRSRAFPRYLSAHSAGPGSQLIAAP